MALTYTQLQTAVSDYVENTFSATDFATMTRLAEQKIYQAASLPTLRKNTSIVLSIGNPLVNLPSDFLASYSYAVVLANGNYEYLLNKEVGFMQESFPNPATTGTPKYYALNGAPSTPLVQTFRLGPTPGAALTTVLNYMAYPESISTAGTSWLGENFESVLFNGVMVEAARFMKQEPDIVAMYEKQFQESLVLLKVLSDGKDTTDQYRSGQTRSKVG